MFRDLSGFPDEKRRLMAIDFKSFDNSIPGSMIRATFEIYAQLLEAAGVPKGGPDKVRLLGISVSNPWIVARGDMYHFTGSNPSGQSCTTATNSLVNMMWMIIAWVSVGYPMCDFFDVVRIHTYGDDNVMSVPATHPKYNQVSIRDALAHYGVRITMAGDKNASVVEYTLPTDLEYLGRKFVYDDELATYLAPLRFSSIGKMLTVFKTARKSATQVEVRLQCLQSAILELTFHGRKVFERLTPILYATFMAEGTVLPESYPCPTFDELVERHITGVLASRSLVA